MYLIVLDVNLDISNNKLDDKSEFYLYNMKCLTVLDYVRYKFRW